MSSRPRFDIGAMMMVKRLESALRDPLFCYRSRSTSCLYLASGGRR
jgi:hypothetical protein